MTAGLVAALGGAVAMLATAARAEGPAVSSVRRQAGGSRASRIRTPIDER